MGLPEKYNWESGRGGGSGPKVELNPEPKKIQILGQFDTLKIYTSKTWYPKNIVFFVVV